MSTETELLPCPFCGAEAQCKPDDYGSGGQHVPPHLAGCRACRVFMVEEDEADAIAAWNRRSAPPAWQDIATAPRDGRTILLGYFNGNGKWRTVRGQWFSQDAVNEWENGDECPEGWYETSVECQDDYNVWKTEPTHWRALPLPPHAEGGRDGTDGVRVDGGTSNG